MELMVKKVVSLSEARSLVAQRAHALLGPSPTVTFQPDAGDGEVCCCVRLHPIDGASWLGVVSDKALFADRVRMGIRPRFVAHHNADTPTVCGDARVAIVGRIATDRALPDGLGEAARAAARILLAEASFPLRDAVLIEVHPEHVRVDEGEAPAHGAIPRT